MFSDGIYVASLCLVLRNLLVLGVFRKNKKLRSSSSESRPKRQISACFQKHFLIPASSLTFQLLSTHRRSEKVYRGSLSRDQLNRKLIVTVSQVIVCCTFLHGWRSRKSRRFIIFLHRNGKLGAIKAQQAGNFFLQRF